jgi:hypothetical protein
MSHQDSGKEIRGSKSLFFARKKTQQNATEVSELRTEGVPNVANFASREMDCYEGCAK